MFTLINSVISVILAKSPASLNKSATSHTEKGLLNLGVFPIPQSQPCCQCPKIPIDAF